MNNASSASITILIADDDRALRKITAEILTSWGYQVLQAANGLEALSAFKAHQNRIRLALLDVVMPHCSGIELAKHIRKLNPDLPIFFVTGYDREYLRDADHQLTDIEIFNKPVHIELLIQSVERVLKLQSDSTVMK